VTVQVAVPSKLSEEAQAALAEYTKATSGEDPRPELTALLQQRSD
jgi:molecular chaperone DnaJ